MDELISVHRHKHSKQFHVLLTKALLISLATTEIKVIQLFKIHFLNENWLIIPLTIINSDVVMRNRECQMDGEFGHSAWISFCCKLPTSKALNPSVTLPTGAARNRSVSWFASWFLTTTRCLSRLNSRPWGLSIVNSCWEFLNKNIIFQNVVLKALDAKTISWMRLQCVTNKWLKDVRACFQNTPLAVNMGDRCVDMLVVTAFFLFFNCHRIRCVSVVCFSSDASSADSQHQHLTVLANSTIIPPTSVYKICEEVKCRFFSFLSDDSGWGEVEAAGCRGGERGFGDWQTLRSHASLVVIKNKHSEGGKETHIPPELGQIQGTEKERTLWPFTPLNINKAAHQ